VNLRLMWPSHRLDTEGPKEKRDGLGPALSVAVSGPGEIFRKKQCLQDGLKFYLLSPPYNFS